MQWYIHAFLPHVTVLMLPRTTPTIRLNGASATCFVSDSKVEEDGGDGGRRNSPTSRKAKNGNPGGSTYEHEGTQRVANEAKWVEKRASCRWDEPRKTSLKSPRRLCLSPKTMESYEPKSILITGAAGFIASHVANRLIRNHPDYKIVVLDRLDDCSNLKNLSHSASSPNYTFVRGDITNTHLLRSLLILESIDTVMHFAAQTHVGNFFYNPLEFTRSNVYGTHALLEVCKGSDLIKRFIHASTGEVYGETDDNAIEDSMLLSTNPCSAIKVCAEQLVMAYGSTYGLSVIITRINNVYGPNQFPEKLIPKFILLAMRGQTSLQLGLRID
ncbi:trifunctional UDP-glucose 4,6-dehydratase/UDP-4-keto-6-deoxy-D-glucose 3,5-epimerase/UDP-4-keto-L-rhamnose-reductase RHM1-like, partial [Phalaenopsis equestris]|uniref:trifunctional UDP-glucose 4,6-dehydratase/UDP-4-keto-6-deoxy-D-glucose 3,5-epimerase/UDP-4-keto-L-rhamnose-reductase RHM1-like n=1 Tax=Phalaenopsis equestris TaxID=78828 RepID=UPI0009E40847